MGVFFHEGFVVFQTARSPDQEMELKLKAAHNDDMHSLLAQHLGVEEFWSKTLTCIDWI